MSKINELFEIPKNFHTILCALLFFCIILAIASLCFIFTLLSPTLRLLGICFAITTLVNPKYGIYLIGLTLPLFGHQQGAMSALRLVDIVLIGVAISWALRLMTSQKMTIAKTRFDFWILLLVISTLASFVCMTAQLYETYRADSSMALFLARVFSFYGVDYHWAVKHFVDFLLSIILFYYIATNTDRKFMSRFLGCVLVSFAVSVIAGLFDFFHLIPLTFYRPENPEILKFGYNRLMSLFGHSGWYAEYLVLVIPFVCGYAFFANGKRQKWAIALLICALFTLLLTYQRGGWLAFAVSGLFFFFVLKTMNRPTRSSLSPGITKVFLTLFSICIIVGLATFILTLKNGSPLAQRVLEVPNFLDRKSYFLSGWLLYISSPAIGHGIGSFPSIYPLNIPEFYTGAYSSDSLTAHNTYLNVLIERGIVGLISFVSIVWIAIGANVKTLRTPHQSRQHMYALGCAGALVAFATYAFFQYMFFIRIISIFFWIIVGFTAVLSHSSDEPPIVRSKATKRVKAIVATLVFLISVGIAFSRINSDKGKYRWEKRNNIYWQFGKKEFDFVTYVEKQRMILPVRVPHKDAQTNPVKLKISLNGERVEKLTIRDNLLHTIDVLIPPTLLNTAVIHVEVSRIWQPKEDESARFVKRKLGAEIGQPIWSNALTTDYELKSFDGGEKELFNSASGDQFAKWEFFGASSSSLSPAHSIERDGTIGIALDNNNNAYGIWNTPDKSFALEDGYLYRCEFEIASDVPDSEKVPQIKVGLGKEDSMFTSLYTIISTSENCSSPTLDPVKYTLYSFPNSIPAIPVETFAHPEEKRLWAMFSAFNHFPDDAASAEITMSKCTVSAIPYRMMRSTGTKFKDDLSKASDWTFRMPPGLDLEGGGNPVEAYHSAGEGYLTLAPNEQKSSFGEFENIVPIIPQKSRIYRARFSLKTSHVPVDSLPLVVTLKLGLSDDSLTSVVNLTREFYYNKELYPTIVSKDYDVYFCLPEGCGEIRSGLKAAFGIAQFMPTKSHFRPEVILENVTIEELEIQR